ncbi:NAD(P)/FAD-dependent oxidoreductase [Hyalangium versicolor]|uniref:NAD(P)/FAD-dependent oxidoreductase n=1 Tax=Hyalangium versicolor TaxID=2861190 RepID=UPI001CCF0B10|nr:FAD-dependent oxidoreductase [Hyalangium versicolor]
MPVGHSQTYDAVVIGAGFFGCSLARHLSGFLGRVLLVEREPEPMRRASYANQARVHNGYHYPRSLLTALRSRVNFGRFVSEYADCIRSDFEKFYPIALQHSHVTANQFQTFCERIGAPIEPATPQVRALFDPDRVESVFRVQEFAFDAVKLRERVLRELWETSTQLRMRTEVTKLSPWRDGCIAVDLREDGAGDQVVARYVFNCTYARLNALLQASGLRTLPLKYEVAEMALVEVPPELREVGVTVMCGPFFSVMPFPSKGLHTLSHVRYTPHHSWQDMADGCGRDPYQHLENYERRTNFELMLRDAQRYLPVMEGCRYVESLWEMKTVLPSSEVDDSRPILFKRDHGLKNLICLMGGKIDNIYDVLQEVDVLRKRGELN